MSEIIQNGINKSARIIGFDVARALAIIGMVIVNFKGAMNAELAGSDLLVWFASIFDGRAAALFVVLAGVGISLLTKKSRESGNPELIKKDRITLLKRALFLFIVGFLYAPLWPADILHYYGIYIALSALIFTIPNKYFWWIAGGLTTVYVFMVTSMNYELGWNMATLEYSGFWTVQGQLRNLFFNGFHPVIPWFSFLAVGLWLGRLDLRIKALRRKIMWWSLLVAVVTEVLSFILMSVFTGELGLIFQTKPMPPVPLYMVAGCATAVFIIMVCLELTFKYPNSKIFKPLVATGQLALTLYVAHVVIGMGFLETIGKLSNQTLAFSLTCSLVFCVAAIIFSSWWRNKHKRGPLETLMRKVTG